MKPWDLEAAKKQIDWEKVNYQYKSPTDNKSSSTASTITKPTPTTKTTTNKTTTSTLPKLNIDANEFYSLSKKIAQVRPEEFYKTVSRKGGLDAYLAKYNDYLRNYNLTADQKKNIQTLIDRARLRYNTGQKRLGDTAAKNTTQSKTNNTG